MRNWFFKKKNIDKKKILIIADKKNWAYDSIAKSLIKYNKTELLFELDYIKNKKHNLKQVHSDFDLIFVLGWQLLASIENDKIIEKFDFLDKKKVITGIHSHHSWDNKKTLPDNEVKPPKILVEYLNQYKSINCVSKRLYNLFVSSGVKNIFLTENGVDIDIFTQKKKFIIENKLKVGFSGNSQNHDWRKGVSEFIVPATKISDTQLFEANKTEELLIPLEKMPNFYQNIDVYVCASSSEGFSLSVLEASATGIPIISTKVGGCEDFILDGVNGFLVNRNVESIAEKLEFFKKNTQKIKEMGKKNREIIINNYSWKIKILSWLNFINNSIG